MVTSWTRLSRLRGDLQKPMEKKRIAGSVIGLTRRSNPYSETMKLPASEQAGHSISGILRLARDAPGQGKDSTGMQGTHRGVGQ